MKSLSGYIAQRFGRKPLTHELRSIRSKTLNSLRTPRYTDPLPPRCAPDPSVPSGTFEDGDIPTHTGGVRP